MMVLVQVIIIFAILGTSLFGTRVLQFSSFKNALIHLTEQVRIQRVFL